jgi:hypothetical protein
MVFSSATSPELGGRFENLMVFSSAATAAGRGGSGRVHQKEGPKDPTSSDEVA